MSMSSPTASRNWPKPFSMLAAQKFAHRNTEEFARQVPQGNLHAADRCHRDASLRTCSPFASEHFGAKWFDIEWILSDHDIAEISQNYLLNPTAPVRLTDSCNASVRLNFHKSRLRVRLDKHCLYVRNFDLFLQRRSHCMIAGESCGGRNQGSHSF